MAPVDSTEGALDFGMACRTAKYRPIAILAKERFDCVLMDVEMPVMSGIETMREMRKELATSAIGVIAMSANDTSQIREQCLSAGANAFLNKPFNSEVLFSLLAGFISGNGREPEVVNG